MKKVVDGHEKKSGKSILTKNEEKPKCSCAKTGKKKPQGEMR